MQDLSAILDRAVAAEAAGRIQWPAGFWSWPLAKRVQWASERIGDSPAARAPAAPALAHELPLKRTSRSTIGFITPSFASCGGVETWFLSLAPRLSDFDWLIAVCIPSRADAAAVAVLSSIGQVRVGPGAAQAVAAQSDLLVAWGECETPAFDGPRVLVSHGCDQYTRRYLAERSHWATHWIGVSRAALEAFPKPRSDRPLPSPQIIYNGVDGLRIAPVIGRAAMRASWGLAESEIALVHFGRIADDKFPTAPAVAVRELGGPFRSVFVGADSDNREFQQRVRRLDPLAVFRPPTPLAGDVLAAADVVLCCAPSEGFGLTAVETLIAGRPLVATPTGVLPELVECFGPVCEAVPFRHDADQLAAAVRRAMARERTNDVSDALRDWLNADRMADVWGRLFRSTLVESDAPHA